MTDDPKRPLVWDLPTRVFHWTLVALIALQFASGEFGLIPMTWHYWLGYATLALIVFRVLWGFAGSTTSRFASFVRGPVGVVRYVRALLRGETTGEVGHNPLGGWSVLAMLASVAVQAISGLFASDDLTETGPLAARVSDDIVKWMTSIHHVDRWILVLLIVLHVGAVIAHALLRRENLVAPMWHGRGAEGSRRIAPLRLAGALIVVSALVVWGVVAWGERG